MTFFTWFLNLIDCRWNRNRKTSCRSGRSTLNEGQRCWPCCCDSCCSERSHVLLNPKAVLRSLPFLTDSFTLKIGKAYQFSELFGKEFFHSEMGTSWSGDLCISAPHPRHKGDAYALTQNIYSKPRRWASYLGNDAPSPSSAISFSRGKRDLDACR